MDSGTDNKTVETAGSEIEDKDDGTSNKEQETRVIEDESNTGTEKKIEGTGRSEIEDKYEVSSNKEDTKVLEDESDTGTENKTVETAGSEIEDKYDGSSNKEEDTAVSHDELKTGMKKKPEETGGIIIEDTEEATSEDSKEVNLGIKSQYEEGTSNKAVDGAVFENYSNNGTENKIEETGGTKIGDTEEAACEYKEDINSGIERQYKERTSNKEEEDVVVSEDELNKWRKNKVEEIGLIKIKDGKSSLTATSDISVIMPTSLAAHSAEASSEKKPEE